ncbi:MAG TPA: phospholipase D-like domain-containing protein [Thermoanaerobaculia bacterium]|jgi:cardiolipin synthase|nr:phospholipase D-like domain-containing protein [Thermoanaerobaculia bacterium]
MIAIPIWLFVAMALAIVLLGTMLWNNLREREFHVRVPDLDSFEEALPSIAGMTKAVILEGNRAEILQNGDEFFPALLDSIARAKETIHFETYVWWSGDICDEVADAFAARARDGLEVRVMIDAMGSTKMQRYLRERMTEAGCKVATYHPIRLIDLGQLNKRTHRKLAIFDGREAFIFGHGISRLWTGHGQDKDHWRDTGVRLHGPVVNGVQSVFGQHWIEETGEVLVGEKYFPHLDPAGDIRMHVLAGAPLGGVSDLELMFKMSIAAAQKELIIQNPYFIADEETSSLLKRAVKRGVEVKIMVPGKITDSPIVSHAGHRHFSEMLHAGVRIFWFERTLIHQKIMIIDGIWSHVGSTNLDSRSFDINEEAGVGIIDEGIAAELKAAFEEDLKSSVELKAESWDRGYSLWHRAFDRACYMISGQL